MKIVEIENCNECVFFQKATLTTQRKCGKENKTIDYATKFINHFPEWCPLEDKVEELKYTFTLNCEKCGNAYDSDFAFPAEQLCPSCDNERI